MIARIEQTGVSLAKLVVASTLFASANVNALTVTGLNTDSNGNGLVPPIRIVAMVAVPGTVGPTTEDVIISSSGLLSSGADNIRIETDSKSVTIDSSNKNPQAMLSTAGRNIYVAGSSATVNIGKGSVIEALQSAIEINSSLTMVNNAGTVRSTSLPAILLSGSAVSSKITNESTGVIETTIGTRAAFEFGAGSVAGYLSNAGTIRSTGDQVIKIDSTFNELVNLSSGKIETAVAGSDAIYVTDNTVSGTINNQGLMTATNGAVIKIEGSVDVKNSGTIEKKGSEVGGEPAAIFINNANPHTVNINNTSVIKVGDLSTNVDVIQIDGAGITGSITNSGTMTARNGSVINLKAGDFTGDIKNITGGVMLNDPTSTNPGININAKITGVLNNQGQMKFTTSNAAIFGTAAAQVTGGIINSGTITNINKAGSAIDLSASALLTKVVQNDGTITGAVKLANTNGDIFELNGGEIIGDVTSTAAGSLFSINGGMLTGNLEFIGKDSTGNIITHTGGLINGKIQDKSTMTKDATYLVKGKVMSGGEIDSIANISIEIAGSKLEQNHAITNLATKLETAADTTFVAGASVTGAGYAINNNGTITVKPTVALTTSGNVNSFATGTLDFQITDPTIFGKINTTGAGTVTLAAGSKIKATISGDGFIPDNSVYTVITSAGALTDNGFKLVQPTSTTVSFTSAPTANTLTLTAHRQAFEPLANTFNGTEVARGLDAIIANPPLLPDLANLIGQLDALATVNELNTAFTTLHPQVDGGLALVTTRVFNNMFFELSRHLRNGHDLNSEFSVLNPHELSNYYNAGDDSVYGYEQGFWGRVYTTRLSHKTVPDFAGYRGVAQGIIFGYDRHISERLVMGGAVSYAYADIDSKAAAASSQEVEAASVAVYSRYDYPNAWFIDTMAALARNNVNTSRVILIGAFMPATPTMGESGGWQFGFNVEGGHKLTYGKYHINPMAKVRYTRQSLDPYTETGFGALLVTPGNTHEFVTSIGAKFYSTNAFVEATYVPEFRFFVSEDWVGDAQEATSNFLGSSVTFRTIGFAPAKLSYDFGFGLLAISRHNLRFKLDYDLEIKDKFKSHTGSIKCRWEW